MSSGQSENKEDRIARLRSLLESREVKSEEPSELSREKAVARFTRRPKKDASRLTATVQKPWQPAVAGVLDIVAGIILVGASSMYWTFDTSPSDYMAYSESILTMLRAIVLGVFGVLAVVGGVCALFRRKWGLAVAGSFCALFAILGIPAIILTALSKHDFDDFTGAQKKRRGHRRVEHAAGRGEKRRSDKRHVPPQFEVKVVVIGAAIGCLLGFIGGLLSGHAGLLVFGWIVPGAIGAQVGNFVRRRRYFKTVAVKEAEKPDLSGPFKKA